ncbi:MAG: ABC transporter permease [Oscillospiraceae bacterium]|nr:ABC transporter permease [Oscillospiraceae bacterium]MBR6616682.1 ABC transporter permease [Oscillospiraceae bacterium]
MMHLLKKELSELINKQMILGLLGTLLLIILFGGIMTNTVTESMTVSGDLHIVDCDDTEFTRSVIAALEEDGYTVHTADTAQDLPALLEENGWKDAVVIEEGFSKAILEERTAGKMQSISLLTSTTSMEMLAGGNDSLSPVRAKIKELLMAQVIGEDMKFLADPIKTTPYTVANGKISQTDTYTLINSLSVFDKLMPLVLFMLIVLTSQTIITAIGAEKADKTLETLLASPVPRGRIIGSKMLAALIVALIYALTYGAGFLVAILMTMSGKDGSLDVAEAFKSMATATKATQELGLQIPMWGWAMTLVQLALTLGIALMASIILGALVQDAKGSQMASLPILVLTMFPYILSMISDIRQMEGIAGIVMNLIPFTHTFTATSCLRFHDLPMFWGGLLYQAIFLAVMTFLALKLYQSDILFIGMPRIGKKKEKN